MDLRDTKNNIEMVEEKGRSLSFSVYSLRTPMLMQTLECKSQEGQNFVLFVAVSPGSISCQVAQSTAKVC